MYNFVKTFTRRNKMKRTLLSLGLVIIMLVAFAVPAMASAEVDAVEAALKKIEAAFPQAAKQVSDARAWLASDGESLAAGSGAKVAAQIDAAISTAGSAKTMAAMSAEQQEKIVGNIQAAATAAGLKAAVSADGKTITVTDSAGKVISTASAANPVKQTGIDTTTIVIITIAITTLFGVAVVAAVATRKKGNPNVA